MAVRSCQRVLFMSGIVKRRYNFKLNKMKKYRGYYILRKVKHLNEEGEIEYRRELLPCKVSSFIVPTHRFYKEAIKSMV